MARETRSRGVAPPSRVYHSSPALQQVQFPSRRKNVRTYGRQRPASLRQQTLTQIDFVSSFDDGDDDDDDVVVLTDSDADAGDKENRRPVLGAAGTESDGRLELGDEDPVPPAGRRRRKSDKRPAPEPEPVSGASSKRKRTLGDETEAKRPARAKSPRRRTLGDAPPSSSYHTQTLTQFLGPRVVVADSDDDAADDLGAAADDGFLDWLADAGSPGAPRSQATPQPRQESVVPQTPARCSTAARDAPDSPTAAMVARYGPPDQRTSPLGARQSPANAGPVELTGLPRHREATPSRIARGRHRAAEAESSPPAKETGSGLDEIPDTDDDDGGFGAEGADADDDFGAGPETQFVMAQLESGSERPSPAPATPPLIRKPLRRPQPPTSPGAESQRVPASVLRSLPPHTDRSDIVLRLAAAPLAALVAGRSVALSAPFRVPAQVVRLWLLGDDALLRYMACVARPAARPAARHGPAWRLPLAQIYELNNPVREPDMRRDAWFHGPVATYAYLPPAVVGQLLWNLRHALFPFADATHDDDAAARETPAATLSLSQQVAAQLHGDMASSTPLVPSTPIRPPPPRRPQPSQATTVSQASATPETHPRPPPPPSSCGSLASLDHGVSLASLPLSSTAADQLLSKSQMLPDSLVRDDRPPPPAEIWDSDDDADAHL